MPRRLIEVMQDQEAENQNKTYKSKKTVDEIIANDGLKDKQISGKVNTKTYEAFKLINKRQGISNNSAINMLINKYIRENKQILNEEDFF